MVDVGIVKEMGKKLSKGVACPLLLPTYMRKYYDNIDVTGVLIGLGILDGVAAFACLGLGITFGNFYATAVGTGIVSTNLVSGLYEWYRYEKNKLKDPATKVSELEEKVDEPVKPEETKPVEKPRFINPFEVELPEVKK